MTLTLTRPASATMEERVGTIFAAALAEHKKFDFFDRAKLSQFIAEDLSRVGKLETIARRPLSISREMAEEIGAVKVHSGVGSSDHPFLPKDNPKLRDKTFLFWADRNRLRRGYNIMWHVAQLRSGITTPTDLFDTEWSHEKIKELIVEYGPSLIYTGYEAETDSLDEVLRRPGGNIPFEKVFIHRGTPRNTVGGAQDFKLPKGSLEEGKKVVHVSHSAHLVRTMHILGKYPYLPAGSELYLSPVPMSDDGLDEFTLMEMRGTLFYTFLKDEAAVVPHKYRMLADTLPQV